MPLPAFNFARPVGKGLIAPVAEVMGTGIVLSNSGRTVLNPTSSVRNTVFSGGKWAYRLYFEMEIVGGSSLAANTLIGVAGKNANTDAILGSDTNGFSYRPSDGIWIGNNSSNLGSAASSTPIIGSVYQIAADFIGSAAPYKTGFTGYLTACRLWVGHNNVWLGGGDPATGVTTGSLAIPSLRNTGKLRPAVSMGSNQNISVRGRFSTDEFLYDPPAGFHPWTIHEDDNRVAEFPPTGWQRGITLTNWQWWTDPPSLLKSSDLTVRTNVNGWTSCMLGYDFSSAIIPNTAGAKYYFEFDSNNTTATSVVFGVCKIDRFLVSGDGLKDPNGTANHWPGWWNFSVGWFPSGTTLLKRYNYANNGNVNVSTYNFTNGTVATTDRYGVAIDATGSVIKIWIHKNGGYVQGDPVAGTGDIMTDDASTDAGGTALNIGPMALTLSVFNGAVGDNAKANVYLKSSKWEYSPPTGFGELKTIIDT